MIYYLSVLHIALKPPSRALRRKTWGKKAKPDCSSARKIASNRTNTGQKMSSQRATDSELS